MSREIDKLLQEAHSLIIQAERIADLTGETFQFDLAYGMGGTYYPKTLTKDEAVKILRSGDELSEEEREGIAKILSGDAEDYYETGWVSSSSMC